MSSYSMEIGTWNYEIVTEYDDDLPVGSHEVERGGYTNSYPLGENDDLINEIAITVGHVDSERAAAILDAVHEIRARSLDAYSCEPFAPGGWYSERYDEPYKAEYTQTTLSLVGFSDDEQRAVRALLVAEGWRNHA